MSVHETTHPQATDAELKFLDRIFSSAIFTVKPDTWFDAGTEATPISWMYLVGSSQPCALFRGKKDGHDDEESCCISEFTVTWMDESFGDDGEP